MSAPASSDMLQSDDTLHLRLLQTTDLHMRLLSYDYFADRPAPQGGLARLAPLITEARAEAANCLLLDNGDFLQGTPMGDLFADPDVIDSTGIHPMIAAMNALGFDATTLGNHEFNYGLPTLDRALRDAAFPVVAGNITRPGGPSLPPWMILPLTATDTTGRPHTLRIGLIGLAPPQITAWDRAMLNGVIRMQGICDAARAHIPTMRAQGADLIIALAHTGIGDARDRPDLENAAVPLAAIDGIDAILCGHQHQTFPGPRFQGLDHVDTRTSTIHGKPAMMPGFWGSHLGVMDLTLRRGADGAWRIGDHTVALRTAPDAAHDTAPDAPTVQRAVSAAHSATLTHIRQPVGHTTTPLHSYFTLIADDAAVQLVAEAQGTRTAELLQGRPHADLPLLSAAAPFKVGGQAGPDFYSDVPAGPLSRRNMADLYLFPNTLQAVEVTGAQLHDWLERAAGLYCQITPGRPDQTLRNPDFPAYNFDVICGLRYRIDLSQPPRFAIDGTLPDPAVHRVTDITHDGRAIRPDDRFVVATNSYRIGSSLMAPLGQLPVALDTRERIRDVLLRHIARTGTITPPRRPVWRFAAMPPGTSALFDTGPGAAAYLDGPHLPPLERLGFTPQGFMRLRLHL
ncbi:bifunctional 2',3'-cyclic-nucleotide 2'-phosphodiesterase/3'-nucleotidase [Sediminimonas sp.]|uniref:bifunctional 2',3'-cyclic-nucleotide 2'-phosphodiesterase/3'-nucleotidase n=1 Tax=Sediminimonas sp. TaxID=2823379 RepID=UPI00286FE35C|nr:bifunctional 2',3'-cyclic-nucleotide 2'-phosphodiesterase/3'-nucleotidase [Sediminimonas sp.]